MKNLVQLKKLSLVLGFASSFLILSCSKEDQIVKKELNAIDKNEFLLIPNTAKEINLKSFREEAVSEDVFESEEFAKFLTKALLDKDFRKFLQSEANKKVDGDFDVLLKDVVNAKIGNNTFKNKYSNKSNKGVEIIEKALKNSKLQISIPVHLEKWKPENQLLIVAVNTGAIENKTKVLKGYDSNGKMYLLDAEKEPNVPVIIIGNNERMDYKVENEKNQLRELRGLKIGYMLPATRVSGNYEKITYIRCPNLTNIESWHFGAPEIRFDVVVYMDGSAAAVQAAANKLYAVNRTQSSLGYELSQYSQVQNLFRWNFDLNHGPDFFIKTFEIDDSGTAQKLTVGVTAGKKDVISGSAAYEISYKNQDKPMKGELIHYTHPRISTIGDSDIEFRLENEY